MVVGLAECLKEAVLKVVATVEVGGCDLCARV